MHMWDAAQDGTFLTCALICVKNNKYSVKHFKVEQKFSQL